jgi:hypothetical protein
LERNEDKLMSIENITNPLEEIEDCAIFIDDLACKIQLGGYLRIPMIRHLQKSFNLSVAKAILVIEDYIKLEKKGT